MQWQQLAYYALMIVLPFFIGKAAARRVSLGWLPGLVITIAASTAIMFALWMLMRVYIGRRGGSLGLMLNLEFSAPYLIIAAIIGALTFTIVKLMRRRAA
ncbi:hypothetical protein [Pseudaestuariivita rosea]|uniref:hypothetical protein n=1 Tax=Pseudaestuariivita rosea TaxID=2763263 RepID=UPI001ABB80E9|nr:hypothetical protein [Pseudaestuariivita rosea]